MAATESVEKTFGREDQASSKSEGEAKSNDQRAQAADNAHRTPKKRRKVNHGESATPCLGSFRWTRASSPS